MFLRCLCLSVSLCLYCMGVMSGSLGPRQIGELDSGWWIFVRFLALFCYVGARVCVWGYDVGRGSVWTPRRSYYSYLGWPYLGWRVLGWFVREARDKALAKLGSRPGYFSFCGFWLLWL